MSLHRMCFRFLASAALACTTALIGCARPPVELKTPAPQPEADATWDWQNVARQIALDMSQRGLLPASPTSASETHKSPYFIKVTGPSSAFLHEARQSLQTEILRRGGAVSDTSAGAVTISLTSDLVYWPSAHLHHDGAPSSEVAWEASITSGDQVIFDVRYPMYVSTLDTGLYTDPPVGPPAVQLQYAR